jgi:hypothetical protein
MKHPLITNFEISSKIYDKAIMNGFGLRKKLKKIEFNLLNKKLLSIEKLRLFIFILFLPALKY